mmetsp:Transcript_15166/g.25860  ORF Transcript_15166/g.25860 Transcript_15166/m.25860 type:complete len:82 (-) Transcript_15166:196-441(-)
MHFSIFLICLQKCPQIFLGFLEWAMEYTKPPSVLVIKPNHPTMVSLTPNIIMPAMDESTPFNVPATAVDRGLFTAVHQKVA